MSANNSCEIDYSIDLSRYGLSEKDMTAIAMYTMQFINASCVISLVDLQTEKMTEINLKYRGTNKPTNVLTFVYPSHQSHLTHKQNHENLYYGEICFCYDIIVKEALTQHKPLSHHAMHLFIHGILHMCGYDHETESEALKMENTEANILSHFNINNPYLS